MQFVLDNAKLKNLEFSLLELDKINLEQGRHKIAERGQRLIPYKRYPWIRVMMMGAYEFL